MNKKNLLSRAEMKMGVVVDGTPGGDNGNPCANGGCSALGGMLTAQYGNGTVRIGNCNDYPYDSTCHNSCVTPSGPNIWC